MIKPSFSQQELAFFEEGDVLADNAPTIDEFHDLPGNNEDPDNEPGWMKRARAVFSLVTPR